MWGLTLEEAGDRTAPSRAPIEVWPENWQPMRVFSAMGTQWRTDSGYATGFDYSVLPEIWRRTKTPPADRDEVFDCLQVMEVAALEHMHRARKEKKHG